VRLKQHTQASPIHRRNRPEIAKLEFFCIYFRLQHRNWHALRYAAARSARRLRFPSPEEREINEMREGKP
jgi:hypothetical protein